MGAPEFLASGRDALPLVHMPMAELLLPGESRRLVINHAEGLAALDAAKDGVIGSLLVTPHKNALSTTSLLEVREVRKEAVGVCVDVVAVGRLHIPKIEQGRWHEARGVTAVRDETRGSEAQDEDAEAGEGGEGDVSGPTLLRVRRQLEARALEERTRRLRDELCVLSLDAPPAPSLARLYGAWGVPDETAALAQVTRQILLTSSSSSPSPSPPASTTASASALLSAPLLCRLRRAERCPARDGAGDG